MFLFHKKNFCSTKRNNFYLGQVLPSNNVLTTDGASLALAKAADVECSPARLVVGATMKPNKEQISETKQRSATRYKNWSGILQTFVSIGSKYDKGFRWANLYCHRLDLTSCTFLIYCQLFWVALTAIVVKCKFCHKLHRNHGTC